MSEPKVGPCTAPVSLLSNLGTVDRVPQAQVVPVGLLQPLKTRTVLVERGALGA
jgi:hypothetical protein